VLQCNQEFTLQHVTGRRTLQSGEGGQRFGTSVDMILYIDGGPAKEETETAAELKKRREKALKHSNKPDHARITYRQQPTPEKRHFTNVRAGLASSTGRWRVRGALWII
jgi:hypothetical protein